MTGTFDHPKVALPLAGLRVLDFSRLLPGPWCTQMLGDLGAEVIKIEQPETGDFSRHNPPTYRSGSVYFHSVNRNKSSLSLDLSKPEGREIAHRLIESADVLVESFRRGVPARLGIDYDAASALKSDLIYCSITGFGQSGTYADIPGHDLVVQAATGLIGVAAGNGAATVPGFQAGDYAAAAYATIGILAALNRRGTSGNGCFLDISMFDSLFSMCNIVFTSAMGQISGNTSKQMMEVWGGNPRYAIYRAKDGLPVAVSLLEARIWKAFCQLIGQPELVSAAESPVDRHSSHGDRSVTYRQAIEDYCSSMPRSELIAKMLSANIPISPVNDPNEALVDPHVRDRELIEWIEHPVEGRIPQIANPLARSGIANTTRSGAPALGGDNDAILASLGFSQDERERMRLNKIIGS
jgi:crotonobetainyl-CoA:carnitine CoA-transferase CaiB-like acyl-CoA transferase